MIKRNENSSCEGFTTGEKNLVFQNQPPNQPPSVPPQTPSKAPKAPQASPTQQLGVEVATGHSKDEREKLKDEIDDPKKLILAFDSEFHKRMVDIIQTVDENGQKYKFDKWISNTSWGDNAATNEICDEIRKVCKDFPSQKSIDTLTGGLKNPQSDLHAQCLSTLQRCVKDLHEKKRVMEEAQTSVEQAHDIPVAKGLSDMFKNFSSFYGQQDGAGKIALIGSLFFVGKLLMDKELMEQESPFGCTWKQVRNFALAGLGLNYIVAAVRDDHEAPVSFGLDKKLEDVPYQLRAILDKAGVKDAAQIAALGRLATFDKAEMTEWYNLYLQSRGTGSINPEQTPFNFCNLTALGSEQRGRDLYRMMQTMVKDAVYQDSHGNVLKGEVAFKKKYLDDPSKDHNFMSIAYDLNYFSKPNPTPEAEEANKDVIEEQLFPALEKEGPLGDFEPRVSDNAMGGYLKSVPVSITPIPKGDKKFAFKVAVSDTDVIEIDPSADKAALRGQLETLDGYLKKDISRRIQNHPELQGKEPEWVSEGRWSVSNVTITGTHHDKVYVTAHKTESDKFYLQYGKRNILCGTSSLEMSDRNAIYAEKITDYPGKPFEGLYVHVASTEKNGNKVILKGEIARTTFTAELDETTGALKMLDFNYGASTFTNEKRINATNSIFPKDIFHKLGNLAEMAPEKSYLKDSVNEGYWKGLVEFKHYEALNIYESFLKRAKTPEEVAAADRRLANALQEVKNLHAQISKEIGAEGTKVSAADFAEWMQGLDNMNFWYSNNEYRKFMLDVRESLKDKDFEGLGEDEYEVFMLIYREVSDSTSKFSVLGRNLNNYEKSYLEYVKEQIRQLVLQSENDKPKFSLTVKGIKGLFERVDESIKPEDVRKFLNIQPYHDWAVENNVPSGYMDVDSEPIPGGGQPEVLPDGRFTERGAYLGLQARYNRVKSALSTVDEKELKDKGKFYTALTEKINKRYDDSKKVAGLPTRAKQDAELKNYVAELRDICKKHLSAAGYAKFIDALPSEMKL